MAVRVSYGSRASVNTQDANTAGMYTRRGLARAPCASLEQLTQALKEDINAGADSVLPECTTSELSLDLKALVPLHRPNIGPYADGGEHDLPREFKTSWTNADDDTTGGASSKKSHPQATVESIIALNDPRIRQSVQRAASRGIVAALEAIDGFKYSFNNAWAAKDEDGQRFSYICQDSMQNKDRHANGFTRTQKHLKGDGERGARKPTYDCKGSVSVKCSSNRRCIDVYYRHYAIHPTVGERKALPRRPPPKRISFDASGGAGPDPAPPVDTGGLRGMLQAEDSAYAAPPSTQVNPVASQQQPSNIGKPLKRKRDSDAPPSSQTKPDGKAMSLVDILKQSQSAKSPPKPSPVTPKTMTNMYPPPVKYDLPSWQVPPPVPIQRPTQQAAGGQYGAPYPPPYQPIRSQRPPARMAMPPPPPPPQVHPRPPPREYFGPPRTHPRGQGLFSTLRPVVPDPPIAGTTPVCSARARTSCTNCRFSKKKVSAHKIPNGFERIR